MKKFISHRKLSVALCALLAVSIIGPALFSAAAAGESVSITASSLAENSDPGVPSESQEDAASSSLPADPIPAPSLVESSGAASSGSDVEAEEDPGDGQFSPFAFGDSSITVSGVTAGGLAAAVTAANGGSSDFSGLLALTVSGTLNASDFTFLGGLPALQTLDLSACALAFGTTFIPAVFANHTSLVSVSLPTLTPYFADNDLFSGCSSLVSVSITSAYGFGARVFYQCTSLQSVAMPASYYISPSMFSGCTSLTSFDASGAVTVGNAAFLSCKSLASVNLSGGSKTIESFAFNGCSVLTSITMPASSRLDAYSFANCASLASIDLSGALLIGNGVLSSNPSLTQIALPADRILPPYTYSECTGLTSVDLTAVQGFGEGVFQNCTRLQSVTLPASYSMPAAMFQGCSALESINLSGAASLGASGLANCIALTDVVMPPRPTAIPDSLFSNCWMLQRIDLSNATSIGEYAFMSCMFLYDITWPGAPLTDATLGSFAFFQTAQDFTKGFPPTSGLTDANVARVAPYQAPRVYFLLPNGSSSTITQGDPFPDPWALRTQFGTDYAEMCTDPAFDSWRTPGLRPPTVSVSATRDGVPLSGVDTNVPGTYSIRYSIPGWTFADRHELTYTLVVRPGASSSSSSTPSSSSSSSPSSSSSSSSASSSSPAPSSTSSESGSSLTPGGGASSSLPPAPNPSPSPPAFSGIPEGPVYVGDEFTLIPLIAEEIRRDGWGWDEGAFTVTVQDGSARFRADKPGNAAIWYVLRSGFRLRLDIKILERQSNCIHIILCLAVLLLLAGLVLFFIWRRRQRQTPPAE